MSMIKRAVLGLTAAALLTVPLAACSSGKSSDSSSSAASSSAADNKPVATVNDLSKGKMTQVTLDKGFTDALTTLKLTPGVTGTASLDAATGTLSFPITGGNVVYYKPGSVDPYVQGDIKHQGSGISLTAGTGATAKKVTLTNFDIDPGKSKLYGDVALNGAPVGTHLYLFNLDGSTLKPLQTSGTDAILEGTRVLISPDAAALLNKTFGTTAVTDTLLVGIAKITIATS